MEPILKKADIPKLVKLGVGSIWFGKLWPPGNDKWFHPDLFEVEFYLKEVVALASAPGESVLLDTSPGYGDAECLIGRALQNLKLSASKKLLVATKFGEYLDPISGEVIIDFSVERLHSSLTNSYALLGNLNIIFMHLTSNLCESKALEILNDLDLSTEVTLIREKRKYGVKMIGVTLSNVKLLTEVLEKNLLQDFEVLQVPGWIVRQQPNLIKQWKERQVNNIVVVNSPVRHKPAEMTPKNAYISVLNNEFVDVVLSGTRFHWQETAEAFSSRTG